MRMTSATPAISMALSPGPAAIANCMARLEKKLSTQGDAFLESLATSNPLKI